LPALHFSAYNAKLRCEPRQRAQDVPLMAHHAGIAQLVERNLAKVEVASSSLVSRSRFQKGSRGFPFLSEFPFEVPLGAIAKRLCSGLQIRVAQFDSGSRLQTRQRQSGLHGRFVAYAPAAQFGAGPDGEIGRRSGLKIRGPSKACGFESRSGHHDAWNPPQLFQHSTGPSRRSARNTASRSDSAAPPSFHDGSPCGMSKRT